MLISTSWHINGYQVHAVASRPPRGRDADLQADVEGFPKDETKHLLEIIFILQLFWCTDRRPL